MIRSSFFEEIFGNSLDEIAPPIHEQSEPVLPMDVPTHDNFSKAIKTAEVDQLEHSAFVTSLVGDVPTRDAAGIRPTSAQADAPFLKGFLEEVLPTTDVIGAWAPNAIQQFGELLKSAARPSRKAILDNKLAPLYRPEIREGWNAMLDKLAAENADTLDGSSLLRKATAYLEIAA